MHATAAPALGLRTETWGALGTSAVLRYEGPTNPAARLAAERAIAAIDAAASRFRADSELSRLNAATGAWLSVSPLLREAVALAIRAARISSGAVDPTLGRSLIELGYDRDWRELCAIPAGAPLRPADRILVRRRTHWEDIQVRDDPPGVRVPAGVTLDLGATAKALAADRAAAAASRAGGVGVLIALGGDIATSGPAPPGGWRIRVTDDHRSGSHAPGQTVAIHSGGLATSSIVTRRWSHRGRPMHHILDPRDGGPVRTTWRTASVAAGSCADANIGSTGSIVLGAEAPDWLAGQALPARLVDLDGTVRAIGEWPR